MSTATEWKRFRRRIESLRRATGEQIQSYPAPIPACDAQFNHLLELRRLLPQELARLDKAVAGGEASIGDFVRSSPCRDALTPLAMADKAPARSSEAGGRSPRNPRRSDGIHPESERRP